MFPWWKGWTSRLEELATDLPFRIGLAVVIALLHIAMFSRAGHVRLGVPFNSAPGEAPYYSDINAPATRNVYPRQPHHWSRLVVSRWDAQHYIGFATRGLASCPSAPDPAKSEAENDGAYLACGLAWYPWYGLAGGAVSKVTTIPPDYALLLLSVIAAALLNFLWTSRAILDRLGKLETYAMLAAFNLFPTAFYLVTPYTEAATLAFAIGALLLIVLNRWMPAAALIGAATAMRASAISFAAAFGAAALASTWQRKKQGDPRWWWPMASTPLAVWGLVAQMLAFRLLLGDANAYVRARRAFMGGQVHYDWIRFVSPTWWVKGFTTQHMDTAVLTAAIAIVALCGREALKKFELPARVFIIVATLAGFVLAVIAPYQYWGINRYLLALPLIFLSLGVLARKHMGLFVVWLVFSSLFYWHVELCSYVAHGNPEVCPCLGRVEWTAPYDS
jgi:hypothetical protein